MGPWISTDGSTGCTTRGSTPSRSKAAHRRSGSARTGRACWSSPAATRMAGGRRAATVPRSTPPSSPSSGASAERAGRDPMAIVPAKMIVCLLGERDEIRRDAPRSRSSKPIALQLTAESLRARGYRPSDGRPLARHPGHRARQADPRAPARVPRDGGRRRHPAVVPHGTPQRGRARRSRPSTTPVFASRRSSTTAAWRDRSSRAPRRRRCAKPRTKRCG